MRPLTLHVLETALSQLAAWRADGLELHVAVNLAVQNLLDLRTPGQIARRCWTPRAAAAALTLEVTESLMLHDPQRAGEVLADLAGARRRTSRSTTSAPATPRSSTSSGCRSTSSRSTSRS